jgi:hypothetical protein
MQHLDGSGAWPSYIYDARFLKVKDHGSILNVDQFHLNFLLSTTVNY